MLVLRVAMHRSILFGEQYSMKTDDVNIPSVREADEVFERFTRMPAPARISSRIGFALVII